MSRYGAIHASISVAHIIRGVPTGAPLPGYPLSRRLAERAVILARVARDQRERDDEDEERDRDNDEAGRDKCPDDRNSPPFGRVRVPPHDPVPEPVADELGHCAKGEAGERDTTQQARVLAVPRQGERHQCEPNADHPASST